VCRSGNIGKHADHHGQGDEQPKFVHQPQRKRAERAEHQPEQDQLAAAKAVGQRAANHVAQQTKDGKQPQHQPGLGHADVKPLGDVEREEGKQQRPAHPVDEGDEHHQPELAGKLAVNFLQARNHTHLIKKTTEALCP
jgi:hypothetical protein